MPMIDTTFPRGMAISIPLRIGRRLSYQKFRPLISTRLSECAMMSEIEIGEHCNGDAVRAAQCLHVGAIARTFAQLQKVRFTAMTVHEERNSLAISFRGLRKSYADTPVLDGLELDVPAGRTFGLVGINGAGKTTLIKCLLDFCEFDGGDIRIFGLPSQATNARARLAF